MSGEHDFTPCCMRLCSFLLCLIRVFEITHPENMILLLCCMRLCSFSGLSYTCLRDNTSVEHDFTLVLYEIVFLHALSYTCLWDNTSEIFLVCPFSFGHCIFCPSSIYGFWLSLWYLLTYLSSNLSLVCTLCSICK